MKILLLNPPKFKENISIDPILTRCTGVPSKAPYLWPPIGLAYIAGYIQEIANVKILDAQAENLNVYQIAEKCKNFDLIVFNLGTVTADRDISICEKIKQETSAKIALIGQFASYFHSDLIQNNAIDFIIRGEVEKPLYNLIKNFENSKKIKGITLKENRKIRINESESPIENLDSCPFASRHLLPNEKYYDILTDKKPITFMITSRGCPYSCTFCSAKIYSKKYRYRSAENVAKEIEIIISEGFRDISIFDDTFTINRKRVIELTNLIKDLNISWRCLSRVDTVDKEMLEKMYDSGCYQIQFGVESGDQKILDEMKKGITIKQIKNAFKWCNDIGIETVAFFILGHPKETKESIEKTKNLLYELKPDFATFNLLTPLPGSEIYEALKPKEKWEKFDFTSTSFCSIPSEEMENEIGEMYRKYYLRFGYITNRIKKVHKFSDLKRIILQNIKFWVMRKGVLWRFIGK
ncbi:MAG: radical SAM protein [Candidatus Aenigmatarchaeota archaeon]